MVSARTSAVIDAAKSLYDSQLRTKLEATGLGRYIAIEPESGDYFLADSLDAAVDAALDKYPDRLTHTIRIGHVAAIHLGVLVQ
jgi:hypothetical protein